MVSSRDDIVRLEAWMLSLMAASRPGGEPVGKFRETVQGVARLLAPLL